MPSLPKTTDEAALPHRHLRHHRGGCSLHIWLCDPHGTTLPRRPQPRANSRRIERERDTELQALRDSLDNEIERNNHLEAAHQQNEEQSAELSKRHDELTKSFATYRTEAEKDRIKMKKMELLLMSYAQPATHEEIRNLKAFFAAIEAALSEDEQIRWQKLESFRKMKQLLKRLPHQGL